MRFAGGARFVVVFCLLLAAFFTFPLCAEEGPQIIAHRCFNAAESAPENSLEALQAALERDYLCGVEMDVWITADGVVVVHHDRVIGALSLEDSCYDELRDFTLSNGEPLPTLASFLELLRERPELKAVIEIKQHASTENGLRAADAVARLVADYGMEKQVEYQSFDVDVCKRLMACDPAALVGYPRGDLPPAVLLERGFSIMDYHYGVLFACPSWIAEAQGLGLQANAYTVNSYLDMLHAANLGINCLTTDFPEALHGLLEWRQESALSSLVTWPQLTRVLCVLRNTPLAIVYALQDACGKAAGGPEPDTLALAQFCSWWSGGILLCALLAAAFAESAGGAGQQAFQPSSGLRAFVLSFCSLRGRISPFAFWWRQLVLLLPLCLCTYYACYVGQSAGGVSLLGEVAVMSVLLSQLCPPAFCSSALACMSVHYVGEQACAAELFGSLLAANVAGVVCLFLSLLAAWCCFALVLRRLRDSRFGLWLFPLCLCLPWTQFIMLTHHRPVWLDDALILLVQLVALLCLCLPSRRA